MNFKIKRIPNTEHILKTVKENNNYCPCKIEKIDDNKCICKEFLNEMFESDCECGLYTKVLINKE